MRAYGVKRNWNATEDYLRNGCACSHKLHRKLMKIMHRRERRTSKQMTKNLSLDNLYQS